MTTTTTTQARKILTPALQKKVEARVHECLAMAKKAYPAHADKFNEFPTIRYNIKNRFGGVAISGGPDDFTIRLNLILCYENEEHFIEQTVGHEVAHLVQRRVFGSTKQVGDKTKKVMAHGIEWKEVMVKFGLEPAKYHTYDTSSIDMGKKKRSKRGSVVSDSGVAEMLKRMQNGYNRLPDEAKTAFAEWVMSLENVS